MDTSPRGRDSAPTGPRAVRPSQAHRTLGWTAVALSLGGLLSALIVAPPDAIQGEAARLMYLHVPAAWTAYTAFLCVLVAAVGYLRQRDLRWGLYARVAAQIGVVCTALTIVAGSFWGHLVWGVWWAWDPRLVSTALLLLVYVAFLAAQSIGADRHRATARASLLGIAGCGLIPVVHFSVVWWRSLHQEATLLGADRTPPIDLLMLVTLLLCVIASLTVATWVFLVRAAAVVQEADAEAHAEVSRS